MSYELNLKAAQEWAAEKHEGQDYGGGLYTDHLAHVHSVLIRFGYNPNLKDADEAHLKLSRNLTIAAWLHDIVEDTDVTLNDVKNRFGKRVASIVNGVTNEPGASRKIRHKKTYPKTKRIPGAFILKQADRIANVEKCRATHSGLINMYWKEWKGFQAEFEGYGDEYMWEYLRRLMSRPDGES